MSHEEDALDLSRKLQTCQLPTKFLGHSCASAELQRTLAGYDGLPEDHLKWLLRGVEVPIQALPSGPLTIIIVGDSTLSSLNVNNTFTNLDKQCKSGLRTYLSLFSPLGSTGIALGERRLVGQVKAMLREVVGERVVVGLCLGSAPDREKRNPMETATNLGTLHDQFTAEVMHHDVPVILFPGYELLHTGSSACAGGGGARSSLLLLLEFPGATSHLGSPSRPR